MNNGATLPPWYRVLVGFTQSTVMQIINTPEILITFIHFAKVLNESGSVKVLFLIWIIRLVFTTYSKKSFKLMTFLTLRYRNVKNLQLSHFHKVYPLPLQWRRSLPHKKQSIDLLCKSVDGFLCDWDLHHERVNTGFVCK